MIGRGTPLADMMAGNAYPELLRAKEIPPLDYPKQLDPSLWPVLWRTVQLVEPWVKKGQVEIPEIDETVDAVTERFSPIYQQVGNIGPENWRFEGYEISDLDYTDWVTRFQRSKNAADTLLERIAVQVIFMRPLPPGLALFLAKHLQGNVDRPTSTATKPTLVARDTLLSAAAKQVSDETGKSLSFSKTRQKRGDTIPIRGCTVAAAALHAFGIHVSPSRAVDIVFKAELPVERFEKAGFTNRPIVRALLQNQSESSFRNLEESDAHYRDLTLKAASYLSR
jgi:hypothetical protein